MHSWRIAYIWEKVEDRLPPQNGISFAHFRGGDDITEELIDRKQIVGNLPDIVEQALVVIKII